LLNIPKSRSNIKKTTIANANRTNGWLIKLSIIELKDKYSLKKS
jgi:hypothetical protein